MILIAGPPFGLGHQIAERANWGQLADCGGYTMSWGEEMPKRPPYFTCRAMKNVTPQTLRSALLPLIRQLTAEGCEYRKALEWARDQVQQVNSRPWMCRHYLEFERILDR